jgi:hypothetical protein
VSNFIKDLDWGQYWEGQMSFFIEPYFNMNLKQKNKFISWTSLRSNDIYKSKKDWWRFDVLYNIYEMENIIPQSQVKFEVKVDKYDNTGNICIEKKCSGKLSGTFHTESEYFIYYMPRITDNNLYLCKPETLKQFLLDNYENKLRSVGDGGRSESYIINKEEFDNKYLEQKIGKLLSWNQTIPERFNVKKFEKITTISNELKEYGDPFDFNI